MSRIKNTFEKLKKRNEGALIPYIPVGYPTMDSSETIIKTICHAGADILELGVPCADPLADGPTIQEASAQALDNGINLNECIKMVHKLRSNGLETPIVLMGYCNSFLAYGLEQLATDASKAGVDGFIIPDLPSTMADPWLTVFRPYGLDLIFFLAPTTSNTRMASVVKKGSGFLYCISVNGVTGERENMPKELPVFLKHVRAVTDSPLCVGFGISSANHVTEVCEYADGAIVGSALINVMKHAAPNEIETVVRSYIASLKEATQKKLIT
ncbi:tryptophan synthase subunit alpha [Bacillus sp. WMMC1349]|uniref:tryptophan synthase subunit alpha n=1 Tax=Bacillus sp. WMMC1349 TaxID=2736254 RepID=UPI001557EEA5|nr:tryptophan synthase subunit alpha [Bacillus sp. WMMC1349]NPC91332.1 tryptophan synthase subunit alpha [Bacillus sp. WMMC1349]